MNYENQITDVLGKIKGTYYAIRKVVGKEVVESDPSEEEGQESNPSRKLHSFNNPIKETPGEISRLQSLKSQGVDSFKGSAYKGKGSVNTETKIFNRAFRSQRDGKH